jgi:pyruvate, water dikinase
LYLVEREDVPMLIVDLQDELAKSQDLTGGKAASLAQIHALNVPTPRGFCVTTEAYIDHLDQLWSSSTGSNRIHISFGQPTLSSDALATLRQRIIAADISVALQKAIRSALASLASFIKDSPLRLAVRSSATTEDQPEASFAGQHDTFLNVVGEDAIVDQIKRCWASLWSERAYFYRTKKGFDHWKSSMAVVVEELVPAEIAGTLFMANPVTRNKNEAVIEASWGLGEMVVSGRVTPDTYYIHLEHETPIVTRKIIKTKRKMLLPCLDERNGVYEAEVPEQDTKRPALSNEVILELVLLGMTLSKHYGRPSDIEWALYMGKLFILQARPITSLDKNR